MKKLISVMVVIAAVFLGAVSMLACGDKNGGDKPGPATYTVKYDGSGGANAPDQSIVNAGTEITVADGITKIGYAFSGWTNGGHTYNAGDKYKVTTDTTFAAAWTPYTYTVKFDGNGGNGEMSDIACTYDESWALPDNAYMLGAAEFKGWSITKDGQVAYADKQTVSNLTAENNAEVTLYAVWKIPAPIGFSQAEYSYDKAAGHDLELPVTLNGCNVVSVEIDDETVNPDMWRYDADRGTVDVSEEFVIYLPLGEYEIKLITDSDSDTVAKCKLTVENTVKSGFDTQTEKTYAYGLSEGVAFEVTGNVTIKALYSEGIAVPSDMYSFASGTLTVNGEWIKKYIGKAEFTVLLSNNDVYNFTVNNNTVFYTDYDVTTVHSEVNSNLGLNPLYQYYDNVKITDAPIGSGMDGKVLEITPNTTEVTYNCNGYFTLATDEVDITWRKGGFKTGKYYAVSFDYYTVGTSVGEFQYKISEFYGGHAVPYCKNLLLGEDNDNTLHHFCDAIPYSEISGTGLFLWANFVGGGGKVYVDNFSVVELDGVVSVTTRDYTYQSGADYEITVNDAGLSYELYLGEEKLDFTKDADGAVVFSAETMNKFEIGNNAVRVVTALYESSFNIRVIDTRMAELTETTANFGYYGSGNVRFAGSFEQTSVISLKQKAKSDNGGLPDWELWHSDTSVDYKDYASVTSGLNGTGYLEIDREFLKKFYGETQFDVTFSNGNVQTVTVKSDAVLVANFDESNVVGYCDYEYGKPEDKGEYHLNYGEVINSGFRGGAGEVKERAPGNNAFYVTATAGCAARNLFTVKPHDHPWTLYRANIPAENMMRVTFTYQSTVDGVYFSVMMPATENAEQNFFGTGGTLADVSGWKEMQYPLICDGQVHTFDSGWFTGSSDLRISKIMLPSFTAEDGKFIMVDDYALTQMVPAVLPKYTLGSAEEYVFDLDRKVTSCTLDGEEYAVISADKTTLDKTKLEALEKGVYRFMLTTDIGVYPVEITVKRDGNVEVTETVYDYTYGSSDIEVEGTFEGVTVTSAIKKSSFRMGTYECDTSSPELDISYFDIRGDKLYIKRELLDLLYLTTELTVEFSNGEETTLTVNSNVRFFTDLDETNVMHPLDCGNGYMTQDSAQMSVIEDNGGHVIKYDPTKAVLGHSTTNYQANRIFIINTGWSDNSYYIKTYTDYGGAAVMPTGKDFIISFDYKIVNAEGKTCDYYFASGNGTSDLGEEKLSGAAGEYHTFTTKITDGNVKSGMLGIGCYTAKGVEGCYLLVDNFRVIMIDKE